MTGLTIADAAIAMAELMADWQRSVDSNTVAGTIKRLQTIIRSNPSAHGDRHIIRFVNKKDRSLGFFYVTGPMSTYKDVLSFITADIPVFRQFTPAWFTGAKEFCPMLAYLEKELKTGFAVWKVEAHVRDSIA